MSEQYRGDESFDRLEEMFGDDSALRDTMASLSDEMEWNERATLAAQYPGLFDEPRAYEEVDITATATEIHETFQKLCAEYSINPAHPDISPELLDEIDGELALAVYAMKKSIWSGDTIAVEDALVVDFAEMDDEEDGAPVVAVTTGQKLVGEYVAPGVGPLPDSVYALTDGEVDSAQVGVGSSCRIRVSLIAKQVRCSVICSRATKSSCRLARLGSDSRNMCSSTVPNSSHTREFML